ncbi:LuxR C-terminal-related transcriptional regulator [Emticicia sp. W12TSBA100-4]|uniref:response regulator transcription factor n=1 Tax=Emticicia sp. W12TSBA100-4 TaxID=3160965 RepID=UPI0033063AFF
MSNLSTLQNQIKAIYKKLKGFYEYLPRDTNLEEYIDNFSFTETIERIYAVGTYCWFISDMKNAKWVKVGGAIEQMTGYSTTELHNASFIKAARFTSAEELMATVQSAELFWQYFYSKPIEHRPNIKSSHTYRFIRKNGETFHALQQSSTLFFDKLGNGVYQFDLITDISHLDPIPKLRFYLLDTNDPEDMKNIPIHEGIISKTEPMPISLSEKRVLELIAKGKSIKMIADELGLSENTIKHHRTNMFAKCGVKNMAELTGKALSNGWFE